MFPLSKKIGAFHQTIMLFMASSFVFLLEVACTWMDNKEGLRMPRAGLLEIRIHHLHPLLQRIHHLHARIHGDVLHGGWSSGLVMVTSICWSRVHRAQMFNGDGLCSASDLIGARWLPAFVVDIVEVLG